MKIRLWAWKAAKNTVPAKTECCGAFDTCFRASFAVFLLLTKQSVFMVAYCHEKVSFLYGIRLRYLKQSNNNRQSTRAVAFIVTDCQKCPIRDVKYPDLTSFFAIYALFFTKNDCFDLQYYLTGCILSVCYTFTTLPTESPQNGSFRPCNPQKIRHSPL